MKHSVLTHLLSTTALAVGSAWGSLDTAQALTFTPPTNNTAPRTSTGGASRGSFGFIPSPESTAPRQATGGASRGSFFVPPQGNNAPRQATGGASRNTMFAPPSGNAAPRQATGGASRNTMFAPPTGNASPRQATGGGSRNTMFAPPSGSATPRQAARGASRVGSVAATPMEQQAMKPLVPQSYFGTTVQARPMIMAYVPASDAQEAIFSLKDEDGNMVYQMVLPVSGQAEIMTVQLPANAPALEVGKNYQWLMALKLDSHLRPSSPYVDGWVQRITPTAELAKTLAEGDELADATAFGKMGVWYDCVATLANLRLNEPQSEKSTKNWNDLLSSVGLADIKTAPLKGAISSLAMH
ncbi:MAG: DUF928 domain-containing protein [Synechococcales bacterium]|nr:DUF928 domain-containing protein [Synechococcales bacterium]